MIRIETGRRLHFGLFAPIPVPELNLVYGGLGAMVRATGAIITGIPAAHWSVQGVEAERACRYLEAIRRQAPDLKPVRIEVEYVAPAHQGWGSGTQLALALAELCLRANGMSYNKELLVTLTGRGKRSSIGIMGYQEYGLFLDRGRTIEKDTVNRQILRTTIPEHWRVVLVEPVEQQGLHDKEESEAFERIRYIDQKLVQELQQRAEAIIRAAEVERFEEFADYLTEYNRLAGLHYQPVQGGCYSTSKIAERIQTLQQYGARGVGQSSWGPGLYAWFPGEEQALAFTSRCPKEGCRFLVTQA